MSALPTGTVTLLFTDIEGSTRLLQQLGDGYRPVIADHHRLLREASDLDRATALAEEALPLFQRRDDRWGIQGVISLLIRISQVRGDSARAASLAHENLLLAHTIGSLTAVADHLVYLAWVARVDGRLIGWPACWAPPT